MNSLKRQTDFSSLSISDLLEARNAYHVHLANLDNVVGTAVGRYLIRETDPDAKDSDKPLKKPGNDRRTLNNSVILPWSWPCVLVFVNRWATPEEMANKPENYIPPRLYLPDGRVIPTCVVCAYREKHQGPALSDLHFSDGLLGGGYPVLSFVQGENRVGTIGCLATDGHSVFALTNRHVAGPPGQEAFTVVQDKRIRIGESAGGSIGKVDFAEAYPGWPAIRTKINLDAGLIRVDDLSMWTSQVFGIGQMGPLVDANVDTLSLDLITTPVRAFGGASGDMTGVVTALFYRYRSVGGFEFLADFLIGPREGAETVPTRPGDSGTVWFLDLPPEEPVAGSYDDPPDPLQKRPLAMQWGGDVLAGPGGQERSQFALTSSLATICRALELDLVQDWETGHNQYWGKIGHYKIGAAACQLVKEPKLLQLMTLNLERIALTDDDLRNGRLPMNNQEAFVALADVPDLVWRQDRGKDKANHFADMDEPGTGEFAGKSLMMLWEANKNTLTPATWTKFYDSLSIDADKNRGALPFRIRQIYEEMVKAVQQGNMTRFVGAAGVLAHYAGDACQPLHLSNFHDGRPGPEHSDESGVHAAYETTMPDRFTAELVTGVNARLNGKKVTTTFQGGKNAANRAVTLMRETIRLLPPIDIIEAFVARQGAQRLPFMWETLGTRTIKCMANGAMLLAELWESAWLEGGGPAIADTKIKAQSRTNLQNLYLKKTWVESDWLRNMQFDD